MIRFSLVCDAGHAFEGWFASNDDYDRQAKMGLVACAVCGSAHVEKALMAPSVKTARKSEHRVERDQTQAGEAAPASETPVALTMTPEQAEVAARIHALVREVRANSDNVGKAFAEEARKIHFGEAPPRGIYGEASRDEVESLLEEGVSVAPLPVLPEYRN